MIDIKIIEMTFVNAFLVKVEDGFILSDTGLANFWEQLESELVSAGCVPGKLKLVIITHGDLDHTGNCAKLQEKYKCRIAIHKDDAPMVESGVISKAQNQDTDRKNIYFYKEVEEEKIYF